VTSGLRDRKKAATRRALHVAALELVAERGLDAVSVDEIATAADVSPRTFFNYFPTKDDAVLGLDPDESGSVAAAVAARPGDETPVEALRAVAVERAAEMALDSDLWTLRMRVVDASPVLLAGVSGVAMRTALHRWLATDFTASLPDLVDEAWGVLAAGLPAPR
jgi:AcrR family transcriptional regulator